MFKIGLFINKHLIEPVDKIRTVMNDRRKVHVQLCLMQQTLSYRDCVYRITCC